MKKGEIIKTTPFEMVLIIRDYMPISDARRRANDKWREKFDEVRFRVPKGKKEAIQAHAKEQGKSLNAFLNRAVDEAIERDNKSE